MNIVDLLALTELTDHYAEQQGLWDDTLYAAGDSAAQRRAFLANRHYADRRAAQASIVEG